MFAHLGTVWGNLARHRFLPHTRHQYNLIHSINSGQLVTRGEPETSESAGHRFGVLYPGNISLYTVICQRRPPYIFKMPREKGKEWDHVTIELKDRTHQHKVACKYCNHYLEAGASRTREHLLHINPTCGIVKCTADEAVLQPVLDKMRAMDAQNMAAAAATAAAAAAAAATVQRQLNSTAVNATSSSAPAKKQRLLAVCRGIVRRLG